MFGVYTFPQLDSCRDQALKVFWFLVAVAKNLHMQVSHVLDGNDLEG